jgi:hypothetical protein
MITFHKLLINLVYARVREVAWVRRGEGHQRSRGKKSKRKKLKKQGADAPGTRSSPPKKSDKTNSVLILLGKHAQLQQKVKIPTLSRCWSWHYWRPADEKYGSEVIVRDRLDDLRSMSSRLQCIFCNKSMARSPSTTCKGYISKHYLYFDKYT